MKEIEFSDHHHNSYKTLFFHHLRAIIHVHVIPVKIITKYDKKYQKDSALKSEPSLVPNCISTMNFLKGLVELL